MKKSEPKMILNLSLENEEFENKIKIAMDQYLEKVVNKELEDYILKVVDKRIQALINSHSWSSDNRINGMSFEKFVKEKTEKAIVDAIDANIKDILGKRIAAAIMGGLND